MRLIAGMDGGMHPAYHFTHQLHQRGKQELARILVLGGAGKQGVEALGVQEPFQHGAGHHTNGPLFDKGGKDRLQQHGQHLPAR
jgi:hypothetical protein